MSEPRWRTLLCWGSVILFLTLPLTILGLRILAESHPDNAHLTASLEAAKFIIPYFQSLTALVFGLSGLNVWDKIGSKSSNNKPPKNDPPKE